MYISRAKAVEILAEHDFTPTQPTAIDGCGDNVMESSFDKTFGIKTEYVLEEVMKWLGY